MINLSKSIQKPVDIIRAASISELMNYKKINKNPNVAFGFLFYELE